MPLIAWTGPAFQDLRAIETWLERETSADLASMTLAAIRRRSKFLEDFPRGGRPHRDGTRILRVLGTPYLMRYRMIGDMVQILRVHHEREDWYVAS